MAADDGVYQLRECDRVCLVTRLSLSELIHVVGMVREICSRSCGVMLLAKRNHARPIRSLYHGIDGARFTFLDSWDGVNDALRRVEAEGYRVVPLPSFRDACPYTILGLEISLAYTGLIVRRHPHSEQLLLRRVRDAVGQAYIVVHDDEERRIRAHLVPDGFPVVRVRDPRWRVDNPCEWIQVIDNAVQFHGIESCFLMLADAMGLAARRFCHAYCNPGVGGKPFMYRNVVVVWG